MIKNIAIIYIVGGFILSLIVAWWVARRNPRAFNPIDILFSPFGFIIGLIIWPLWVGISLVEGFGFEVLKKPAIPESSERSKEKLNLAPVGQSGISESPLKPSGKVRIDDRTVDAITEGGYLPAGENVIVTGYSMNNIVVRQKVEPSNRG
jgi:membrane-bound ClpP family serine protease